MELFSAPAPQLTLSHGRLGRRCLGRRLRVRRRTVEDAGERTQPRQQQLQQRLAILDGENAKVTNHLGQQVRQEPQKEGREGRRVPIRRGGVHKRRGRARRSERQLMAVRRHQVRMRRVRERLRQRRAKRSLTVSARYLMEQREEEQTGLDTLVPALHVAGHVAHDRKQVGVHEQRLGDVGGATGGSGGRQRREHLAALEGGT